VSIGTTITNRSLEPNIRSILSPSMASLLLERTEALGMLSGDELSRVRFAFGTSYNKQMYLAVGLAAACLPTAMLAWRTIPAAMPTLTSDNTEMTAIMDPTLAEQSPVGETKH
jgi:hypothetical protein